MEKEERGRGFKEGQVVSGKLIERVEGQG
jgi:hypothetical protein